jgi:predicted tellurium resistance membrane protein TerC
VLSATIFAVIYLFASSDLFTRLGNRNMWSIGLCISTYAFAAFSILGLVAALRVRQSEVNRLVFVHSLGVSILFSIATVYLSCFGMIGIRTWM